MLRRSGLLIAARAAGLAAACCLVPSVSAVSTWIGPNLADWLNDQNWRQDGVPTPPGTFNGAQINVRAPRIAGPGAVAQDVSIDGSTSNQAGLYVEGAGSLMTEHLGVGLSRRGFATVEGGGRITTGSLTLGQGQNANGSLLIQGSGSEVHLQGAEMRLGDFGRGAVVVRDGGMLRIDGLVTAGYQGHSNGTLTVESGGSIVLGGMLYLGYFAVDDGSIATLNIGTGGAPGNVSAAGIDGTALGGSSVCFNHNAACYSFGVYIDGTAQVRHIGSGNTVLTADNLYEGGTLVEAGGLLANNTIGSATGSGPVTVQNAGSLLGGSGSIAGAVVVQAGTVLAPGTSATAGSTARLSLGTLTLAAGAIVQLDLNGTTAGSGYDQVLVSGAVELGGSQLQLNAGPGLSLGSQFTVLRKVEPGPQSGAFAGLPEGASFPASGGYRFRITYVGGNGNDVAVTLIGLPGGPAIDLFSVVAGMGDENGQNVATVTAHGTPAVSYTLQISDELQTWTDTQTLVADANGALPFRILQPLGLLKRFYRVRP